MKQAVILLKLFKKNECRELFSISLIFFVYPGPPAGGERRTEHPQSGASSAQPKSFYTPPVGGLG
jgi:hypothetical protein